jgi:hypothetical protein
MEGAQNQWARPKHATGAFLATQRPDRSARSRCTLTHISITDPASREALPFSAHAHRRAPQARAPRGRVGSNFTTGVANEVPSRALSISSCQSLVGRMSSWATNADTPYKWRRSLRPAVSVFTAKLWLRKRRKASSPQMRLTLSEESERVVDLSKPHSRRQSPLSVAPIPRPRQLCSRRSRCGGRLGHGIISD